MMGTDELREEGNNGIFEEMTETPKKICQYSIC